MKSNFAKNRTQGVAFGDHLGRGGSSASPFRERSTTVRWFLLPIFLVLFFLVLFIKLTSLQLFQGAYYRTLSDTNRIRSVVIHAPRGVIFDRNGKPLVYNVAGYRKIDVATSGAATSTIMDRDTALPLIAKGEKSLEVDSLREYPYKDIFSHMLGYIGQVTQEELTTGDYSSYLATDLVGRMGIENWYEPELKGIDGKELLEVDALGKTIRTLGKTDPIAGSNITLTVDIALQQAAYTAMKNVKKGAAIVTSPTGEVLALISKPAFDPNLFTLGTHYKVATDAAYTTIGQMLNDGDSQPLLDRAIAGMYPPGSTFKLVTAAAGLQTNTIKKDFSITDTGVLKIGQFSFANWYFTEYGKTDGQVDVVKAIKRSNDIFFYTLGDMLGVDKLSAESVKFGLGDRLGIDLDGEAKGLVPTKDWKKKVIGEQWYLGDNYHYGIGQGFLLTTPLQVNAWTQAIANEGELYVPHLLKSEAPNSKSKNLLTKENFELIRQGMVEACAPGGVAWPIFNFKVNNPKLKIDGLDITDAIFATGSAQASESANYRHVSVACKTGTAQHGGEKTLPHAWITLFAPAYHPQIVVTVLNESSGEGSNEAAPIAQKILEAWFSR